MAACRVVVAVLALALVGACGSTPAPTTARPAASEEAQAISDGDWRIATILPPDDASFRVASQASGLIVGDQTMWTTTDGVAWRPAEPIETVNRYGIVPWSGRLVSWAEGGLIQTSPDGLAWTDATVQPDESNPTAILAMPNALLLFGEATRTDASGWRSVDGSTWMSVAGLPKEVRAVATRVQGGTIAVGNIRANAAAWMSSDGASWTPVAAPSVDGGYIDWTGMASGPAGVVATGGFEGQPAAAWSTQGGEAWAAAANAFGPDPFLQGVTAVGGAFVIAGRRNSHPTVWTSPDGRSWSGLDLPIPESSEGEATVVRQTPTGPAVFGYTTEDAGNGGRSRTGYLVWTLPPPS
jgi:hypothetical protein